MKHKFFLKPFLSAAVFVVVAVVGLQGCKKYTEVTTGSQFSIPDVFSEVSFAFSALVGVYDELQGDNGYGIRISMYYPYDSDEAITSGNIDAGRRDVGRYRHSLSNAEFVNPFRQLYRGIEKANIVIEQVPLMRQYNGGTTVEQRELRRIYAEALTLRAQFYFELIRNWGDVPAPMIPAYRQTSVYIGQTSRDSTYDRLLNDLATAKPLLPWRSETTRNERVTRGAAMALRARIALFRGGYSLRTDTRQMERRADYLNYYRIAREECAELMTKRTTEHNLNPSYENVWRSVTSFAYDPVGEVIFEIGAGGGNGNSDSRMGNYDGPNLNNASRYGAGGGGIVILPNYFYAFDSADLRRDITVTSYQVNSANNLKSQRRLGELNTGKYRRDWRVPLLPGTVLNVGYNWVVIRFSDVLLMFAEAENEINGSPTAAAKTAFEEVRRRGFGGNATLIGTTPSDKDGFFNAIVNERWLEFGHEGIRKFDLLRWNLLTAKLTEARTRIQQLRDRTGSAANVPQYIYWRNSGEEIQYYVPGNTAATAVPWYRPTQVPNPTTGWTRVDWSQNLSAASLDVGDGAGSKQLWQAMAFYFTPGKSELFPYDQPTLDSYQGRLRQNPGY